MPPKVKQKMFREMGSIEVRQVEENSRQVELSFSSEEPYARWFGIEVLSHDEGSIDLTRLNDIGVLLFNHGRDKIGGVPIGKVIKAWVDPQGMRCKAIVEFDSDEDSESIFQKVQSGTLKGVSVGYNVDSWEEVAAGKTSSNGRVTGPAYVALKWAPYEISIVSIPADSTVGVGRSMDDLEPVHVIDGTENTKSQEAQMSERAQEFNAETERAEAVKMERQRTSEINSLCRDFGVDPSEHIESGASVDTIRSLILEKMKAERKPQTPSVEIVKDAGDKLRESASDALLMRSGIRVVAAAEGARELMGMSLRDLAIECVIGSKQNALRMDNDSLFREALSGQGAFAAILDSTVNKSMRNAYSTAPTTFEAFTSRGTAKDFRANTKYMISEAGDLEEIKESGEFKRDEMSDMGTKTAIATYGKRFSITRQALINDDIDLITKIPASYVRAAKRGLNRLVYKMLASNPAIFDGKNLFDSTHGNLAGTSAAIGVASLGAGRKAMRVQKNLRSNEILNIGPASLIVPAALETAAETFLLSTGDPGSANANVKNIFNGKLNLVVDAELDAYSPTAWYLAANPSDCDTIEVTYLNGNDTPQLESRVSFDTLGMDWRIFIDYGVDIIDFRGLYKNTGA